VSEPTEDLAEQLREQARWCKSLGSPLYGHLLAHAARDVLAGGPARQVLAGHEHAPLGSALALRFMGAVHRLVLSGRAPALAGFYPSAGEPATAGDPWPAFRETLERCRDELRPLIERPVQTNEVGRSAALLGAFLWVARETRLPLRLLEIGASAGLNLRWDCYRYESDGWSWGDPGSTVVLRGRFASGRPPLEAEARIVSRRGCDPAPLDPTTDDGLLTLTSYVWPDQRERLALLRQAAEIARRVPAVVETADARTWLETKLAEPVPGTATIVFHSIVMQYLDPHDREAVRDVVGAAGVHATPDAPIFRLSMEHGGEQAEVRLRRWPGPDGSELMATAGFHGQAVRWRAR
jgi:hypothetical protein